MSASSDFRLALDPQLCLRNDVDRAVLLTRPQPLSLDRSYASCLVHPKEAVLLSLFDGDRTVHNVRELWSELSGRSPESATRDVDAVVGAYTSEDGADGSPLVEVDERNRASVRQYNPMDFVIPEERINLTDPRLRKPYLITFLPTLFCARRCVYCHVRTSPQPEDDPIPRARLEEIFAELRELGVEVLRMSGGDPFARKDLFDVIESAIEEDLVPDMAAKLGLSYYEALRLRDLGVRLVQVDLDSADPTIADRMAGLKGYHLRVFRVLDSLRRAGLSVRVKTVLTPLTAPAIGRLLDYLGGLGNVMRVRLVSNGGPLFCSRQDSVLSQADRDLVEAQARDRRSLYPHMRISLSLPAPAPGSREEMERRWRERPVCLANRHGFTILPDGRVTACEELYDHPAFLIGDLRRQSVMEMWTSPEARALLHPDQAAVPDGACKTCGVFAQCNRHPGRCWRDVVQAYGADRPWWPDPRCPLVN